LPEQSPAEVISEMMLITKNNRLIGSEVLNHKALSKIAPDGEQGYLKNQIYLMIKEITKTRFGYIDWNESGQPMNEEELTPLAINYYQKWSSFGERERTVAVDDLLEFFEWYWLIYELKQLKEQVKDHSQLMEKLWHRKYIDNIDKDVFNNAMKNGPYPTEKNKVIWIGKPSDANKFCEHLGMVSDGRGRYKVWNRYFILDNGKPLYENTKPDNRRGDIIDLMENEGYPEGYLKNIKKE